MSRHNLLYKAFKSSWMLDPLSAIAASKVLDDMLGAARLKAKYPMMEYDEDVELELAPDDDYYHFRLTHKDNPAIPQGKQVSVIRVEGVMMRDDAMCQPGTRTLAAWLREADADKRVLAHIILTDSGGGAADSVFDMAQAITDCNKPTVAFCDGDMCSAAYYVAVYANYIMANENRNRVGCIGTMIQMAGYPAKSKDEDGYMRLRIYADGSDEKNLEYERALEGDFELLKENVLNPLAVDFQNAVKAHRQKTNADQRRGRTYYAQDVVGSLIDSIGSFDDAVRQALELSTNNITEMKGLEHLQSLESCRDLVMVDGYVPMSGEQLAEIDATLGEARAEHALCETNSATVAEQLTEINALTAERDSLKAEAEQKDARIAELEAKEAELATLTQEHDTLKGEAAQKDARIAELEAALDGEEKEEDPLHAMHNGNHAKTEESAELTDEQAMESARKAVQGKF